MRTVKANVDSRYAYYARQEAIRDVYDALIELITNADDAYVSSGLSYGAIYIERYGKSGKSREIPRIVVTDNAIGLTDEEMDDIADSGAYTNKAGRGFFGRGLKDCLSIAKGIILDSIKDGVYYRGQIYEDDGVKLDLSSSRKAAKADRSKLNIPENGLRVTLVLRKGVKVPRMNNLLEELPSLFQLRPIMSQDSQRSVYIMDGRKRKQEKIRYNMPSGEVKYNDSFKIDGHKCYLKIVRSDDKLDNQDATSKFRKSGIAVVSKRACHDLTLFNNKIKSNPFSLHYCGELKCERIDGLLREFEENRQKNREHPASNPSPVVHASRSGLHEDHPFVKKMYETAGKILQEFVDEDLKNAKNKDNCIISKKTRTIFNKVTTWMGELFDDIEKHDDKYPGGADREEELKANGIMMWPPNHVVIPVGNSRTITVYIMKNAVSDHDGIRVKIDGGHGVVKSISNLREHPLGDRYIGHFEVVGDSITNKEEFDVIEVRCGKLKIDSMLTVPKYCVRVFNHPLEFENKHNFNPGNQEVKLYAGPEVMCGRDEIKYTITTSNSGAASVPCKVKDRIIKLSSGTNYGIAMVPLKCGSVGSKTILKVKAGRYTAETEIRIIDRKIKKSPFVIDFTEQSFDEYRYRWANNHTILVSVLHPSIKGHIGKAPEYEGQDDPVTRSILCNIIADAIVWKAMRERIIKKVDVYKFDGKSEENIVENVNNKYEIEYSAIYSKLMKHFGL